MRLISTRNPKDRASFLEALQGGMAPGGGLYVPEPIPCFRDVSQLLGMDFQTRSTEILHRLLGEEFTREELETVVREAFDFPLPLVRLRERIFAMELFHGPTLGYPDFGVRFLARMLALVSERQGLQLRTVLTATSGDTGAAVAHAFRKQKGVRVMVLYPKEGLTELQEKGFATQGGNVLAYAVDGTFDECQAIVKGCFEDWELVERLSLTSANCLNIARPVAQLLCFFEAVAQLKAQHFRDAPVISIPCGNFGNLYAGLLAQRMGLPVKAFVIATNLNRTVPDSLDSGEYRPRPVVSTLSNALDIGDPSDWERIRALFNGNQEAMRAAFRWGSRTDAETRKSMWEIHATGYLPDPHMAVAHGLLQERLGLKEVGILLATTHPAKYRDLLQGNMNLSIELPPALAGVTDKPVVSRTLPADLEALKAELLN